MRFKQKAFKKRRHNNNHNKSTKQSRSQIDASKYERWRGGTQKPLQGISTSSCSSYCTERNYFNI